MFGEEGAEDAGEGGFVDFHAFAIVALEPEHAVGAAAQGEGREVYLGGGGWGFNAATEDVFTLAEDVAGAGLFVGGVLVEFIDEVFQVVEDLLRGVGLGVGGGAHGIGEGNRIEDE